MKKYFIFCAIVFSISSFGQNTKIVKLGYTSYYNYDTKIPDSCIWTITKEHLLSTKSPRKNQFHASDGCKDLNKDYEGTIFDRGHNSPYDDNYYNDSVAYQSFSFINMFPQISKLNRQTWEHLEVFSRHLALQYDSVKVKTSWIGIDTTIGVDKVVVPQYCVKELWYNNTYEKYVFPNRDSVVNHAFTYYKLK